MSDNEGEHPLRMDRYVDEGEMEITDEELNEILAELEGELDEAGRVDPNVPVAPAPAPVDPTAAAPSTCTRLHQLIRMAAPVAPTPVAPAPAPVAEETEGDEVVDLQELLNSLNEEEIEEEEEEEMDESLDSSGIGKGSRTPSLKASTPDDDKSLDVKLDESDEYCR
jgi:ribosomal protein L12E/L44/L45/RPP1/RPP2